MLPLLGIQFDLIGRGFWKVFLGIWAVGFLNGAISVALMMAIFQISADFMNDNVIFSLAIAAGLVTLLVDGLIIIYRYRWVRHSIEGYPLGYYEPPLSYIDS